MEVFLITDTECNFAPTVASFHHNLGNMDMGYVKGIWKRDMGYGIWKRNIWIELFTTFYWQRPWTSGYDT